MKPNFDEMMTPQKKGQRKPKTQLPAKNILDLEKAKKEFAPYQTAIANMQDQAVALEIINQETAQAAVALGGEAKKLAKKITAQAKAIVEEPEGFVKSVKAFAKMFTDPLTKVETTLKRKHEDYAYKVELDRRKAEQIAQEEAKKLQERLDQEAKEKGVAPVTVTAPVVPKQETVTRTETGTSAFIRTEWKGEIQDPDVVPREFCSPDQKKINDAVKAGLRDIPGVKIFEKPISVFRT